jgi:hypothetical protein
MEQQTKQYLKELLINLIVVAIAFGYAKVIMEFHSSTLKKNQLTKDLLERGVIVERFDVDGRRALVDMTR